ncbi:MAG: helix-turn-helix domain-containing protein [Ignavibacteriaceae bacterium]
MENMISKRIKLYRLARGMSLDDLAAAMGGIVSKMALSKYERGLMLPTNRVTEAIAKVLNVKMIDLLSAPDFKVEFMGYRKGSKLRKSDSESIEGEVLVKLEERMKIQHLLYSDKKPNLPETRFKIRSYDEVEQIAVELRLKWELGMAPIKNLTEVLEQNFIHVIFLESEKAFDGISTRIYSSDGELKAVAVVSRKNIAGGRQRLNLAHELGHILLEVDDELDVEKAAFRFGAALLAPEQEMYKLAGTKRNRFLLEELLLMKRFFGISIQALVTRLVDLEILSEYSAAFWYKLINIKRWKKEEPEKLPEEDSTWLETNAMRAYSEGLISSEEASFMLGREIGEKNNSLIKRREFLKLAKEEREKILRAQAEKLAGHYENEDDWKDLGGELAE